MRATYVNIVGGFLLRRWLHSRSHKTQILFPPEWRISGFGGTKTAHSWGQGNSPYTERRHRDLYAGLRGGRKTRSFTLACPEWWISVKRSGDPMRNNPITCVRVASLSSEYSKIPHDLCNLLTASYLHRSWGDLNYLPPALMVVSACFQSSDFVASPA